MQTEMAWDSFVIVTPKSSAKRLMERQSFQTKKEKKTKEAKGCYGKVAEVPNLLAEYTEVW